MQEDLLGAFYNYEAIDANNVGCGEEKEIKGIIGLCDLLDIQNVTRAGVGGLKAILILETGWMVLPWPKMQSWGKKDNFWGRY